MKICSYLTFNGNCREAMLFYQQCLGGKLAFQTIGDSPLSEKMPQQMKEYILHSTLTKDGLIIIGSDIGGDQPLVRGNGISLMLNCSSQEELEICYDALSAGGQPAHALENTFWGAVFGDLTDKYGNHWLLRFDKIGGFEAVDE